MSKNPNLVATEVRAILRKSCDKIGEYTYVGGVSGAGGRNESYGYGRINAKRALEITPVATPTPAAPVISSATTTDSTCVKISWGAVSGAVCNVGMMLAYKYSDISLAYPAARALPVFFTMTATALFGLGKPLAPITVLGMSIIFSGCIAMAFSNGDKNKSMLQKLLSIKKGLIGILIGALGTTGYTIVDSYGIKEIITAFQQENRFLVTSCYSCARELVAASLMWVGVFIRHQQGKDKGLLKALAVSYHPYLAGIFAGLAYALILLAMNHVDNVSFVQAFRQLSLPVSALLGLWILKEKITLFRWCALGTIMFGLMLSLL